MTKVAATLLVATALVAATATEAEAQEYMVASWYGEAFRGLPTASGELFNPDDYTCAHLTYPFGTRLLITYNGYSVECRVTDRGPYVYGRHLDLSQAAAEAIGLDYVGVDWVSVEVLE